MNRYEQIKQMSIEEMSKWIEEYTRSVIVTLAKQIIEGTTPEQTASEEFKNFLLERVENEKI